MIVWTYWYTVAFFQIPELERTIARLTERLDAQQEMLEQLNNSTGLSKFYCAIIHFL